MWGLPALLAHWFGMGWYRERGRRILPKGFHGGKCPPLVKRRKLAVVTVS